MLSSPVTPSPVRFSSAAEHEASLDAALPAGFRVGTSTFAFRPRELADREARMTLTLIVLDEPTASFAAMFTTNAFPGAPVVVGRARVAPRAPGAPAALLQAVVVNNKISNVCSPTGEADSERVCAGAAAALGLASGGSSVFPSSTGIIGWRLPAEELAAALPDAARALQRDSVLPAARGICTTDLYPKVRARVLPGGARVVGIAKGAGMVEPGLATMLVYVLTDAAIGRDALDGALRAAVAPSFNALSIDSDQSTSDTVLALSSNKAPILPPGSGSPAEEAAAFTRALTAVCCELAEDIVRNGEGVAHVVRVAVHGAPNLEVGRAVGKAVVNSPLLKCAVGGNDPNVGRLVAAIGKCLGAMGPSHGGVDVRAMRLEMGGLPIFARGAFELDPVKEAALVKHLRDAQLWGA